MIVCKSCGYQEAGYGYAENICKECRERKCDRCRNRLQYTAQGAAYCNCWTPDVDDQEAINISVQCLQAAENAQEKTAT